MSQPACTDPAVGSMLFAYEIGALNTEEVDRFELHLLECRHCFETARQFASYARIIRDDRVVRTEITRVGQAEAEGLSFWRRTWQYLWPDVPVIFRPAVLYVLVLILLYPALTVVFTSPTGHFGQLQSISLSPLRSSGTESFSASLGRDGVVSFFFPNADPKGRCTVVIKDADGSVILEDKAFTAFDDLKIGWLVFPAGFMKPGRCTLEVFDPAAGPSDSGQVYYFTIEP